MIGKSDLILLAACLLVGTGVLLSPSSDGKPGATSMQRGYPTAQQASLEGTVVLPPREPDRRRFRGRAYRQRTNRGDRDQSGSGSSSSENRYRSVIISAHPLSFEPTVEPLDPVEVDQTNTSFEPQVTPVTAGTTVEFVNSDPFYHNVFSLTPGARFNIGRRPTGVVVEETIPALDDPAPGMGVVELHCDIHPQMNAFIVTLETPFFTRANADGTFSLDGLPEGRYRILAYTPRQDPVRFEVELSEDERICRTIDLR
jgi:plastocyanin